MCIYFPLLQDKAWFCDLTIKLQIYPTQQAMFLLSLGYIQEQGLANYSPGT